MNLRLRIYYFEYDCCHVIRLILLDLRFFVRFFVVAQISAVRWSILLPRAAQTELSKIGSSADGRTARFFKRYSEKTIGELLHITKRIFVKMQILTLKFVKNVISTLL